MKSSPLSKRGARWKVHEVTITSPKHNESIQTPNDSELLIKEARRKARLRRLQWGCILGIIVALVVVTVAVIGGSGGPPTRSNGKSSGKVAGSGHKSSQTATGLLLPSAFYPQQTLDFVVPSEGWMIGTNSNRILVTHNGGVTWSTSYVESSLLQSNNGFIRSIYFVNVNDGWALINYKGLIATTNAGRTWSHVLDPSAGAPATFTFTDSVNGWALTDSGALLQTTNGAKTWRVVSTPAVGASICATSSGTLWLGDNANGNVYSSLRGAAWRLVLSGKSVPANSNSFGPPPVRPAPWISCTGDTAWLLYNYGEGAGSMPYVVERTLNLGKSWKIVLASEVPHSSPRLTPGISATVVNFGATGAKAAWLSGYCGPCTTGLATLSTTSNASTFTNYAFSTDQKLYVLPIALTFLNSNNGWALVRETKLEGINEEEVFSTTKYILEYTANGGRSWSVSNSDVP
jgi:hypothetical protein